MMSCEWSPPSSSSSSSSSDDERQPAAGKKRKHFMLFDEADHDEVEKAVVRMCRLDPSRNVTDASSVRADMDFFLSKIGNERVELGKRHMKFFTSCSVANALCMLYKSPLKDNQELGARVIKRFIGAVKRLYGKLRVYAVPSVVQLCACLGKTEPRDPLYFNSMQALRTLFDDVLSKDKSARKIRGLVEWQEILPFLIETGQTVLDEISVGLELSSEDIVDFESISEFSSFVSVFENSMTMRVDLDDPITMRCPFYRELLSLYYLFRQLLDKMDMCLARVEKHLSVQQDGRECILDGIESEYLHLIKALSYISDIYEGAKQSLQSMLKMRKDTFCILVMEHASQDQIQIEDKGNHWIFEYKEMLSFDCRWDLAGKIFPEFLEDGYVGGLEMLIDRSELFADSCEQITQADSEGLQDGLSVQFSNEMATGPGVVREWFMSICKEIFNPQHALFIPNPNDQRKFRINPASRVQLRHFDYFRFCGRMIALALLHQVQIGIAFDHVLFNQLAGLEIQLEDIKDTDPTLYQSCKIILDMDADLIDTDVLGLTFTAEFEEFGSRRVEYLHPCGENRKVDSKNRKEYVKELLLYSFNVPTVNQVAHLSKGFSDMLGDSDSLQLFFNCITVEDLNRVLRGSESDISLEDWQAHTDCIGYKDTSREIVWFWKIIKKMSQEKWRLLLYFWTTVNYLPFEGFSGLPRRLQICVAAGTADHLPTSNTCFYQLCIPAYPTYNLMQQRMSVILHEHVATSFGKN